MAIVIIAGTVTGPLEAFQALPKSFAKVKSWDNTTARKTSAECFAALKGAGFTAESVFERHEGSKMLYRLFVYRNQEERRACFESLAGI